MRARRVDSNHADIVAGLRSVGARVLDLSAVGKGCPDLAVAFRGRCTMLEVKRSDGPPSKAQQNDAQREFQASWAAPYVVVRTIEDALVAIGAES